MQNRRLVFNETLTIKEQDVWAESMELFDKFFGWVVRDELKENWYEPITFRCFKGSFRIAVVSIAPNNCWSIRAVCDNDQ